MAGPPNGAAPVAADDARVCGEGPVVAANGKAPLSDRVAQAVIECFERLPSRGKPQGRAWTVLAGIVCEDPAGHLEVLAVATGTRCIGREAMAAGSGLVVHDCHAEVLCRRALHRYLLSEIGHGAAKVLERAEGDAAWRLRPGIRLHFYVSALPCGECALVPISSNSEGTLARKWLRGEKGKEGDVPPEEVWQAPAVDRNRTGAKPAPGMPTDPKADGIGFHSTGVLRYKSGRSDTKAEARSVSFSCSEKLCRWNHVGWQGALLSRIIKDPLAMSTIVIGGPLFDASFVRTALFERAGEPLDAGIRAPEFWHTAVPFHCSREALEVPEGGAGPWTKVSTVGLSIVWSPLCGDFLPRSIARGIDGFYDVLIGHTGERQGLRRDRQGRTPGGGDAIDSWVSPLSKRVLAEDVIRSLAAAVGPKEGVAAWLAAGAGQAQVRGSSSGDAGTAATGAGASGSAAPAAEGSLEGSEPPPKRPRTAADDQGQTAAPAEATRKGNGCAACHNASLHQYSWLKEAACGDAYRERRRRFHAREPFSHWRRKCTIRADSEGYEGWEPAAVDRFSLELPNCAGDAAAERLGLEEPVPS